MAAPPPPPGVIRRLRAFERGKIRDHLLRLDGDDRVLRFGGYASRALVEAYCDGLDWGRAIVIGYLIDGEVRAIGELKPMGDGWPRAGEVAVSVERPFRNRGVGTELLRRLVTMARNRFIETLWMVCLLENGTALHIARKVDSTLIVHQGTAEAHLELAWPNHLTLLAELLDEAGAVLKAALRPAGSAPTAGGVPPLGSYRLLPGTAVPPPLLLPEPG